MWQQLNVEIFWTWQKKDGWPRCPQVKTQKHTTKKGFFFSISDSCFINEKNTPCPKLNRRNKLLWVAFCHRQLFTCRAILISHFAASQSQHVAPRSSRKRTRSELFLSQQTTQLYIIKWLCSCLPLGCFSFSIVVLCAAAPSQWHWNTAEPSWMSVTASFLAVTSQNICCENI